MKILKHYRLKNKNVQDKDVISVPAKLTEKRKFLELNVRKLNASSIAILFEEHATEM